MKKATIRPTTKSCMGTSFHGHVVVASRAQLKKALGSPQYLNESRPYEKTQYEWVLEVGGHVFTVYDWKQFCRVKANELIEWHVGAESVIVADYAQREIEQLLKK